MSLKFATVAIERMGSAFKKSAALLTNSGALAIGTLTTAVLGFVYWWLAARLFPPEAIGRASGLLSLMGLVGLVGEAGLGTLLMGEIARHQSRGPGLVSAAASVAVVLAVGLASSYVVAARLIVSSGLISGWFEGAAFVFGCGLTALNAVVLQAFISNLRGGDRMREQVLFSTLKLVLIAAAAAAGWTSDEVILWTWVAGLLASWIGFDLMTRGGVRQLFGVPDFGLLHVLRYRVFEHYALDVTALAPGVVMPYVVVVLLSPTANAPFASVWMLVSMAALIPAGAATTLFPVARANPAQARHDIVVSLTVSLLFSLVCAGFILVCSREILALFNPVYPKIAGSSLQFLGLSLLGSALKFHACALARMADRMCQAARWFSIGGSLELCLAAVGARLAGLQGLVLGWTFAVSLEGICVALVFGFTTTRVPSRSPSPHGSASDREERARYLPSLVSAHPKSSPSRLQS
jgi:O-antigen/teichoic acid export membrane protein